MKTRTPVAVLGAALLTTSFVALSGAGAARETVPAANVAAGADTYGVDAAHTSVVFRIKHLGVSYFYGRFNAIDGSYALDAENPGASSIEVTVDTESVDTNSERRDNHLKSPDFFNAKQFPEIAFKSTGITKADNGDFLVEGDLTMLGVTKPISVTVEKTGEAETRMGVRSGFETQFNIKRSDYGMSWGVDNGLLGDEVQIMIAVEGVKG